MGKGIYNLVGESIERIKENFNNTPLSQIETVGNMIDIYSEFGGFYKNLKEYKEPIQNLINKKYGNSVEEFK